MARWAKGRPLFGRGSQSERRSRKIRSCRIAHPELVPWTDLHQQFGSDYANLRVFKFKFINHGGGGSLLGALAALGLRAQPLDQSVSSGICTTSREQSRADSSVTPALGAGHTLNAELTEEASRHQERNGHHGTAEPSDSVPPTCSRMIVSMVSCEKHSARSAAFKMRSTIPSCFRERSRAST
jgi:hypothetical protein